MQVKVPAPDVSLKTQVLLVGDGFAVIQGLNNDAPVGCSLKFVSGASGVLLWRRSDNICYALLLGGASTVEVGEGVECRIRAILQVCTRPLTHLLVHVDRSVCKACLPVMCWSMHVRGPHL